MGGHFSSYRKSPGGVAGKHVRLRNVTPPPEA